MRSFILLIMGLLVLPLNAQELTPAEEAAVRSFKNALNLSLEKPDGIWPDYSLEEIPFAFFKHGRRALLLNHPDPPADARDVSLQGGGPMKAVLTEDTAQMTANTSISYRGVHTSIINLSSISGYRDSPFGVGLIYHEGFHSFQALVEKRTGRPWPRENALFVSKYPAGDPLNNALCNLEGKILLEALREKEAEPARKRTRDFLTVRNFRRLFLDEEIVRFEDDLELNEGLAEYAGMKAVLVGAEVDWDHFVENRLMDLGTINLGGKDSSRGRFYHTGLAQALLLDRFMPGWKNAFMASPAPLAKFLQDALAFEDKGSMASLNHLFTHHAFHDTLREEQEAARKKYQEDLKLLRDTLTAGKILVLIDLSPPAPASWISSFDPMNLKTVPGGAMVHTRMLRIEGDDGLVLSFDLPVVQFEKRKIHAFSLPGLEMLALNGQEKALDGRDFDAIFDSIRLEPARLEIHGGRGRALFKDSVLLIRFGRGGDLDWSDYSDFLGIRAGEIPKDDRTQMGVAIPAVGEEGTVIFPDDFTGKNLYVLFFSAQDWAKPSHDYFRLVAEALNDRSLPGENVFVAVACQNRMEMVEGFLGSEPVPFPVLFDGERTLAHLYEVPNYPVILGFNRAGKQIFREDGFDRAKVRTMIKKMFQE